MSWEITDGTNTEALVVRNAPSLDHAIAVEAYDSSVGIKVRGDRLPEPRPLELEVGIHEATWGDALAKLDRIVAIARASSATLRYLEGSETISRSLQGLAGYETTEVHPPQGLLVVRFSLLPTGPYWSSSVRGDLVWGW